MTHRTRRNRFRGKSGSISHRNMVFRQQCRAQTEFCNVGGGGVGDGDDNGNDD